MPQYSPNRWVKVPLGQRVTWAGLLAVALVLIPALVWAEKQVLILHSYDPGYQWTEDIQRGLREVLSRDDSLSFSVEYMDVNRYPGESYLALLADLYEKKYTARGTVFDLIIVSDDNAFEFALENRARLFGDTPIVFCGINDVDPARIRALSRVTGVNERKSIRETIEAALELNPTATGIAVIAGSRLTEQRNLHAFERVAIEYAGRYEITRLVDLEEHELVERLASLNRETIVIFLSYLLTPAGQAFDWRESIRLAVSNPDLMVMALSDFQIRDGILGGMVVHGYNQGLAAARMALQVLGGQDIYTIPPLMNSPNKLLLDDTVLQRFGIDTDAVPNGATLLNPRPDRLVAQWHNEGIKSFFSYDLFENHGTIMFLIDPVSGTIIDANLAARTFYGYPQLIGMRLHAITTLPPDQLSIALSDAQRLRNNRFNAQHRLADDTIRDMLIHVWPATIYDRPLLYAIAFDVTNQVVAEQLSRQQASALTRIAIVVILLGMAVIVALSWLADQLRRAQAERHAQSSRQTALLDAAPNPVFFKDSAGRFVECNAAFERFAGKPRAEIIGRTVFEVMRPEDAAVYHRRDQELMTHPEAVQIYEHRAQNWSGQWFDLLMHKAPVYEEQRRVTGVVGVITDISEQKHRSDELQQSITMQRTLIKELYHRTKNNMQVVSSLLTLQINRLDDPQVQEVLASVVQRIQSMALVHTMLYNSSDLSRIDLVDYLRQLTRSTIGGYRRGTEPVDWTVVGSPLPLLIDFVIPLGLVVNELILNSCKHAFRGGVVGLIEVGVERSASGEITVHYRDNGPGFVPRGGDGGDSSLGMTMIRMLVEHQLNGRLTLQTTGGMQCEIVFVDNTYEDRVRGAAQPKTIAP